MPPDPPDAPAVHPSLETTPSSRGRNAFRWRQAVAALVLLAATVAVFAPACNFGLLDWDDDFYVTQTPAVQQGLTTDGVWWAFTTFRTGNWHPLTWISLMTGTEVFGHDPRYRHRTNVALHIANVLLLFAILGFATEAWGRSFFVAALFAIHPLHVESVAWVTERKDVLSTFLGLLAIGAYVLYTRRKRGWLYASALFFFALSLMAKAMLVTLPLLLLLLDVWPLERIPWPSSASVRDESSGRLAAWLRLARPKLVEKWPFFAFSGIASVLAYIAHLVPTQGATDLPLDVRIVNAFLSIGHYLEKTVVPTRLAAHYPYHFPLPIDVAVAWAIALAAVTAVAFRLRRRHPYLLVGWLWYLVALTPVIGLIQADPTGREAMADRYTYVPLIGIFVAVVWGVETLRRRVRMPAPALAACGLVVLLGFGVMARRQVLVWKNTRTLFRHDIAVAGGSSVAYILLGKVALREGRLDDAVRDFRTARSYPPRSFIPPLEEGIAASMQGRLEEAEWAFQDAIAIAPHEPAPYIELGSLYLQTHRPSKALDALETAQRLSPNYPRLQSLVAQAREAKRARENQPNPAPPAPLGLGLQP